jgi:hypothetical protein
MGNFKRGQCLRKGTSTHTPGTVRIRELGQHHTPEKNILRTENK